MITEVAPVRFVVKVNGVAVCGPQPTRQLAEAVIFSLPAEQRPLAEIVPITTDNKQLLLG